MIDQFSELIELSNECCNFDELTTSMTEVNALKEGVTKYISTKVKLTNNQLKILIKDNNNSILQYIIDPPTGSLSLFGRELIESTLSINSDLLFLFEYFSRFDNSNPPKDYKDILTEKLDPLSYFLFIQELFDSFSAIPIEMEEEQNAFSDIIKWILLHTKRLVLIENVSKLNIEVLKISKKVKGTNFNVFKQIFQESFLRSLIHSNRMSKESINGIQKCLLESAKTSKSQISKITEEIESENTPLHLLSSLVYYESYLKNAFYPFGQNASQIIDHAKAKSTVLFEKISQTLTKGQNYPNGCCVLRISINWEKKFKGTRLSNASFLDVTYRGVKETFEINNDNGPNEGNNGENEKKRDKIKRKNSLESSVQSESSFIEVILPFFSKEDDKADISLVYIKEKFSDTNRKEVPPEGFGILASFSFPLNKQTASGKAKQQSKAKPKSKAKRHDSQEEMQSSNDDFEQDVISNDEDDDQPFVVEFKRKESALSTKCGSITIKSKCYDLQNDNIPDNLRDNIYSSKGKSDDGFSDNFKMSEFLDFYVSGLVNEWIMGKPYRITTTGSTSILMSIYPPQEHYLGLIEFAAKYSIPSSTIFLHLSQTLLNAWCHAESYLNAFTAVFLSAYASLMNNKKLYGKEFITDDEEEIYHFIIEFLVKNVPVFLLQHLSKPALHQKHALLPLFVLLSLVVSEDKIDSYVDKLISTSHNNIIRSVTGYLKPTKLENQSNSEKVIPEIENLMKYINNSDNSILETEKSETSSLEFSKITFSIESLADTMDLLNKRTKQINKFYEDASLPTFLNQWETIKNELCKFTLSLVKMFVNIQNRKDCSDQSAFKFIFAYRELYLFFGEDSDDECEEDKREKPTEMENGIDDNEEDNEIVIHSNREKDEIISEDYSPFKLFFDVILDWIGRIGDQMVVWTTNAVKYDTLEIEDKKQKTSSSLKDMFEVFRQSFNFLGSLHWDDPNIEVFVMTFLSLCGSCLRNYTDTLTLKMLSYFPIKVIREAKIHEIWHFIKDLEEGQGETNNETKVTPRQIFIMINDLINLKLMWNNFLIYVKKMFPSFFPSENNESNSEVPLSSNSSFNSSALYNSSPTVTLPPQVMDPVPKLLGISNSIPSLFSRLTSHHVTDTVSPHLWVKNSTIKTIMVKKASQFILNPEFFKSQSSIYASIFDQILLYIKERIDDINQATCMRYYKTMIVAFLFGLDSGMMNLLVMHPTIDEPIKFKRLTPIIDFIKNIYNEVFSYIKQTAIENVFASDESLESYTPCSEFMFKHINDDPEQIINFVKNNFSQTTIYCGNEKDHEFLLILCAFIIVSSQTNDKRPKVKDWVNENKSRFIGKHFYPPNYK